MDKAKLILNIAAMFVGLMLLVRFNFGTEKFSYWNNVGAVSVPFFLGFFLIKGAGDFLLSIAYGMLNKNIKTRKDLYEE